MFLVIFTALLGNGTVHIGTLSVKASTYYVAAMASFGVITACYSNIAMTLAFQRDAGILKRIDGSPLPGTSFLGSRVVHALFVAVLLVAITAAFGWAFYGAEIPRGVVLLRFLVMLAVGAASFCALGLAVTARRPERRCGPGHRQRQHPPAALPLGHLHPVRQQHPDVDCVDRPDLPGAALRRGHAVRLHRHTLRLDGRDRGGGVGVGRAPAGDPVLQLGAAKRVGPGKGLCSPACGGTSGSRPLWPCPTRISVAPWTTCSTRPGPRRPARARREWDLATLGRIAGGLFGFWALALVLGLVAGFWFPWTFYAVIGGMTITLGIHEVRDPEHLRRS
jgi:hypothetical protein